MGNGNKMLGGNLRWTRIPSRGSSNTPSQLHATETGISSGSVSQFGPLYLHVPLDRVKRFQTFSSGIG